MSTTPNGTRKRMFFYPNPENEKWILKMKEKRVDISSIINLAVDILKPRTGNVGTSDSAITSTIAKKLIEETKNEKLEY